MAASSLAAILITLEYRLCLVVESAVQSIRYTKMSKWFFPEMGLLVLAAMFANVRLENRMGVSPYAVVEAQQAWDLVQLRADYAAAALPETKAIRRDLFRVAASTNADLAALIASVGAQ